MFSALSFASRAKRDRHTEIAAVPKVLVTSRPPRHRIDYVDQLIGDDAAGDAPKGVVFEYGTHPLRARDVDVIHLTDITTVIGGEGLPERERTRRAKRFASVLRRRRIALVRTVDAEEAARPVSRAELILDSVADNLISLNVLGRAGTRTTEVVAHSHLRDRFLGFPVAEPCRGRLVITSATTFDPTHEGALKVFAVADLPGWSLRLAGRVPEGRADSYMRTLADHVKTVSVRDEPLSDAARVFEISNAEVVIITSAASYESQKTLMLALSLDRPVLVQSSTEMDALAEEVGASWIRRHHGPLTAHVLETALDALRAAPPVGRPNLDARDPNAISARYIHIYQSAAARYG